MVRASDELAARLILFVVPEVPLNEQVLTLGVAIDSLTIATKLRVVRRQEAQTGVDAVDEGLDLLLVAKDHPALPVGCHGAEVNHLDVSDRVDDLGGLDGGNLAHDAPSVYFPTAEQPLYNLDFGPFTAAFLRAVCEEA